MMALMDCWLWVGGGLVSLPDLVLAVVCGPVCRGTPYPCTTHSLMLNPVLRLD